jgi:hypothetical protein
MELRPKRWHHWDRAGDTGNATYGEMENGVQYLQRRMEKIEFTTKDYRDATFEVIKSETSSCMQRNSYDIPKLSSNRNVNYTDGSTRKFPKAAYN